MSLWKPLFPLALVNVPLLLEPRIVGSFSNGVQVRSMGPDTDEWVRVRSIDPLLSRWVHRADIEELRR